MRLTIALIILLVPFALFSQGEQILSSHLEKYGQSIWKQINTLEVSGKQVDENYQAIPLSIQIKNNNKVRVKAGSNLLGTTTVLSGNTFWSTGLEGQYLLIEKQIINHALTIGSPLAKYESDLKFIGLDNLDGLTFNAFQKNHEETQVTYLLDKDTDELRYIRIAVQEPEDMMATVFFQKYKLQNGLLTPTAMEITIGEQFKEWVLGEILLGIAIDDKLFEQPKSQ